MPTLLGLDKLLEAQMLEAPLERRRDLELVKELVNQHTRSLAMYKCDNCGFRARQFYWHCPACAAWETYLAASRDGSWQREAKVHTRHD